MSYHDPFPYVTVSKEKMPDARLPLEIRHPFHPQHSLILSSLFFSFSCNVCGKESGGHTYYCSECKFGLHIHCASLIPTKGSTQGPIDHRHHLRSHSHPLMLCEEKNGFRIFCSCCQLPIVKDGPIFVCLECRVVMDESCAGLPPEMEHPFHKPHPLSLTSVLPDDEHVCSACGLVPNGLTFRCSQCDFDLDVHCALLMPNIRASKDEEHGITHPHPLICSYKTKSSSLLSCSGCFRPFEEKDSIYVCLRCKLLLDKSCASLPMEIFNHPFHPTHPLHIFHVRVPILQCMACEMNCEGLGYSCSQCRFYLHFRCALQEPHFVNSRQHQHSLAVINVKGAALRCVECNQSCAYPFFRCLTCRFNLHAHCLSEIPRSVKHRNHLHPLAFTNSPIKDDVDEDDDVEFYCDTCEEQRKLHDPTYYCAECHYVTHVHCVIPEVTLCTITLVYDKQLEDYHHFFFYILTRCSFQIVLYMQRESSLIDKLGTTRLSIAADDVQNNAEAELERDVGEEKVEVDLETTSVGVSSSDREQLRARADDSSVVEKDELVSIDIVGDPIHDTDELDEEIATVQTRIDELEAQIDTLRSQLEMETFKLDQLKKRKSSTKVIT